jgi:hypothetical protein
MIEVLKQAVDWAEKHGEVVFAGGGMKAIEPMNDWVQAGRQAIAELESQEPFCYVYKENGEDFFAPKDGYYPADAKPLYTHPPQRTEPVCPECKAEVLYECVACSRNNYPPQRTWVGLTDDEIEEGIRQSWVTEQAFQSAAWWAEAKLKEKNT